MRRTTPQVIILSLVDFESLLRDETARTQIGNLIRELSPDYNLGTAVSLGNNE